MVGIAKNDLRVNIFQQVASVYALDGSYCAHGHKDRSQYIAMVGMHHACARVAVGIGMY